MSTFEEFDHRIGRHDDAPSATCPICDPSAVNAARGAPDLQTRFWDYGGEWGTVREPQAPKIGDLWHNTKEILVWVTPTSPNTSTDLSTQPSNGMWVSPYFPASSAMVPDQPLVSQLLDASGRKHEAVQTMLGSPSGKLNERVKVMAIQRSLPDEAGLSAPLGVNLVKWMNEQNDARLCVKMQKDGVIPVSEITHTRWSDVPTDLTKVASTVLVIPRPPELAYYQISAF